MKIKVCGISNVKEVEIVTAHGADFCGFILNYPKSHRHISYEQACSLTKIKKINTKYVCVLVNPTKNEFVGITVDGNGRLLLPKGLLSWAGIKKELVIVANVDLWEIWDRKTYESMMKDDWDEFDQLAHEVMGESSDEG